MSSKHVMNDSRNLVNESLAGLVRLNPALKLDQDNRLVHLAEVNPNRVALVSCSTACDSNPPSWAAVQCGPSAGVGGGAVADEWGFPGLQISGGGSGHEPAHAGMVGDGLLSAAACGNVFASPNVGQIRKAIKHVKNNKGTLAVVSVEPLPRPGRRRTWLTLPPSPSPSGCATRATCSCSASPRSSTT